LAVHAGNDFTGSAQQVESINNATPDELGNTAKAVEESSNRLQNGIENLRSAPQELGRKVAQPFVTAATVVSDSAKAVAEVASRASDEKSMEVARDSVGNLAAIPGAVKSRLIDAPIAAIEGAQDTAVKILSVPGKMIRTTQDSVSAVGKVMDRLVALPGRLKDRVDATVSDVQAVAALPGQVSASFSSRVSSAISLPGQALAGIKETMDDAGQRVDTLASGVSKAATSFSNTIDSMATVPGRPQETAAKAANDASIPRSALQSPSDSERSIKSSLDDGADKAAKPPSSQEP
jgi:phage-related protein